MLQEEKKLEKRRKKGDLIIWEIMGCKEYRF
jgi:hypothetical protein